MLPGIEDCAGAGMAFGDLVERYLDQRSAADDYKTDGGAVYVRKYCQALRPNFERFPVLNFCKPDGNQVLLSFRRELWDRGLSPRTVKNYLHQAVAVLRWASAQTPPLFPADLLPVVPAASRRGQKLNMPRFLSWTEADFRVLREHFADDVVATRRLGPSADYGDWVGRRRLALSLAFYTGMHAVDCLQARGAWLSVDMGRYWRHNSKSGTVIRPEPFDMPAQLRLDCEEELSWRGLNCWNAGAGPGDEGERVTCDWKAPSDMLARATKRLFPDGSRCGFTFPIARRSFVRELTIRGWRTHEVSAIMGHVDGKMVDEIYRHCNELGIVSPTRVPWSLASGPNGKPTRTGDVLPFSAVK